MGSCCQWPWEQASVASQNCINTPTNCPTSSGTSSLMCDFPDAKSCGEALSALGERLARRLHGSVLVTKTSMNQYLFSIRVGQSNSSVAVQIGSQCKYPLSASYTTRCSQTGSAQFDDVEQFLNWASLSIK